METLRKGLVEAVVNAENHSGMSDTLDQILAGIVPDAILSELQYKYTHMECFKSPNPVINVNTLEDRYLVARAWHQYLIKFKGALEAALVEASAEDAILTKKYEKMFGE